MLRPGCILLLFSMITTVRAEFQFTVLVDDMVDNVTCFDPETCYPAAAHALVTHLANQTQYTIPIAAAGPDGLPSAYQFVLQGGDILPPGANRIDGWVVEWEGPGFLFTYTWVCGGFDCPDYNDPPVPPQPPVTIPVSDGCVTSVPEPPVGPSAGEGRWCDTPRTPGLLAAYPNPFNPATRITFDLPAGEHVRLTLLNLRGECVHTLLDGYQPAGPHELVLDGSRLATGTYFLRLEAGNRTNTRKLLLLK
jgi:hypothetical protein